MCVLEPALAILDELDAYPGDWLLAQEVEELLTVPGSPRIEGHRAPAERP